MALNCVAPGFASPFVGVEVGLDCRWREWAHPYPRGGVLEHGKAVTRVMRDQAVGRGHAMRCPHSQAREHRAGVVAIGRFSQGWPRGWAPHRGVGTENGALVLGAICLGKLRLGECEAARIGLRVLASLPAFIAIHGVHNQGNPGLCEEVLAARGSRCEQEVHGLCVARRRATRKLKNHVSPRACGRGCTPVASGRWYPQIGACR